MKNFMKIFINKIKGAQLPETGGTLAYNMLFSLFPLLIVILNVVSFFFKGKESSILQILRIFPNSVEEVLRPVVLELVGQASGSLLSISLLVALWSSSMMMKRLMAKIAEAFDYDGSSAILERILALALSLAMVIGFMLILVSGPLSNGLVKIVESLLGKTVIISAFSEVLISIIPPLLMFLILTLTYRLSVYKLDLDFKDLFPATVFAGIGLFLATVGFSIYINNFASYSKTYGSLGGIIVLLLWLYISGIIITMGAYFASSLMEYKKFKTADTSGSKS